MASEPRFSALSSSQVDLQRVAALARGPGVWRSHRDAGGDLEHVDDAGDLARRRCRRSSSPWPRNAGGWATMAVSMFGRWTSWVKRAVPVDLASAVLAPHPVGADQGEVGRGPSASASCGGVDLGGVGQQLGEARLLAATGGETTLSLTVISLAGTLQRAPPRPDEHRPRRRAGRAQLVPGIGDGRRAAGALHAAHAEVGVDLGVGRRPGRPSPCPSRRPAPRRRWRPGRRACPGRTRCAC